MMNFDNMTSKQLKELGKQHGVKNWWNLNKAALIAALTVESEATNETELDTCQPVAGDFESEKTEAIEVEIEVETQDEAVDSEVEIDSELDTCQPEIVKNESEETEKPKIKKLNLKIHELTFEGKTQSIRAWAEELEMPWPTLYDRVNRCGWTTEEALTIPLGGRRKKA